MKESPTKLLKFYADTPAGQVNKMFSFQVKSYDHAVDLAAIFVQEKNFKIRAAYYQNKNNESIRIDKSHDLAKHLNSLILQGDIERQLKIAEAMNNLQDEY